MLGKKKSIFSKIAALSKALVLRILFFVPVPSGKFILFESNPDFSDNTYPVYKLLKTMLPDYKMIYLIKHNSPDYGPFNDADDTAYLDRKNTSLIQRLKYYYYVLRCRAIVCCNLTLRKFRYKQISIFLAHGSETKDVKGFYNMNRKLLDYMNLQSHYFDKSTIENLNCDPSKFVYLGYPRCDYFYSMDNPDNIEHIITGHKFKFIIWLPTFRGHKNKRRDDAVGSVFNNIGVPLFYSIESLEGFNEFLKDKDIHIIYKPHPAQDLDVVKAAMFSNFHIINDSDILGKGLQLYQVIAQSQALITDYSSVFWDYLLLDRPIAVTTDDIASWKQGRGFIIDIEAIHDKIAEKVQDSEGLCRFITDLLEGKDSKQAGRHEIRDISNMWQDGNSALRTANFIIEKLRERYR